MPPLKVPQLVRVVLVAPLLSQRVQQMLPLQVTFRVAMAVPVETVRQMQAQREPQALVDLAWCWQMAAIL